MHKEGSEEAWALDDLNAHCWIEPGGSAHMGHIRFERILRKWILTAGIIAVFMFGQAGCLVSAGHNVRESAFQSLMQVSHINDFVRLSAPVELSNDFKLGSTVDLLLENTSGKYVSFSPDYGVRILAYSEERQDWEDVPNAISYLGDSLDILGPRDEGNWMAVVTVVPRLPDASEEIDIRVVVIGEVLERGSPTGDKAAAFIDLTLIP